MSSHHFLYFLLITQAEEKARSLADDAIFAKAWQERVKELKEEERAEVAEKLAEVRACCTFVFFEWHAISISKLAVHHLAQQQ